MIKKFNEWSKEFDKKFVVTCGTKRVKRVGFWLQQTSDFPTCFYADDIKSFIRSLLLELKEEVEGMKGTASLYADDELSYNQCIEDVLSKLDQMIGGKE